MHGVHRPGGLSVNSTTPSGFACHPSGGGEFWTGWSKGGVFLSPGGVPEGRGIPLPWRGGRRAGWWLEYGGLFKTDQQDIPCLFCIFVYIIRLFEKRRGPQLVTNGDVSRII